MKKFSIEDIKEMKDLILNKGIEEFDKSWKKHLFRIKKIWILEGLE